MIHLHNKWLALILEMQLNANDCCVHVRHVERSRPIDVQAKPVTWVAPVKLTNRLKLRFK